LESRKSSPQLLREFDSKEGSDHLKPALFMTVRREISEPRRRARRSSGSAIAAEVFMINAG